MNPYPFTVALKPNIQVNAINDGYTLTAPELHEANGQESMIEPGITLSKTTGLGDAIAHLQEGNATPEALVQTLVQREGVTAGEQLSAMLQQLEQRGWLNHGVLPLAIAMPMVDSAQLTPSAPQWSQVNVSLSRFAHQRPHEGAMVLESSLSKFRVKLLDWRASALLSQLAQPQSLRQLTPPPAIGPETAYQFLNLLWATNFLTVDAEPATLEPQTCHNLLFQRRNDLSGCALEIADIPSSLEQEQGTTTGKVVPVDKALSEAKLSADAANESIKLHAVTQPMEILPSAPTEIETELATERDNKLAERIPGFIELQTQTLGDERITIVVLDGNADFERSCFEGANVSKVFPYWHPTPESISDEDYLTYLEIQNSGLKGKAKAEKLKESFTDDALVQRIAGDFHATGIISTMVGQPASLVPGTAPHCRVINIPLNTFSDKEEFISALNLARAFELALDLGANLIHCSACRPTQSGLGEDLLAQAVKKCQDNNILIIAPAGNNKGDCWCLPAALPGVLAIGALKDTGKPASYSNWGGNYEFDGIIALGQNILAAQPKTEETDLQQGTSLSAPLVTGISALLMSLQLKQGKPLDAEAIRTALIETAMPCTPGDVEEPEHCLRGKLNLLGVYNLLTSENLRIEQQTDTERSQHLQKVETYYDQMNSVILKDVGATYQAGLVITETQDPFHTTNLYLADRADIQRGDYILDAGCGAGGPAIDIARSIPDVKIEGITISKMQAQAAQKLVQQAGLESRIQICVGDFHHLPYDEEVFDIVYFFESIAYTDNPSQVFSEAYRVLRPGGLLYAKDTFRRESPLSAQEKKDLEKFEQIYAITPVTINHMAQEAELAGFEQVQKQDLSEIVSTHRSLEKMLQSSDGEGRLTDFGKYHYYEFKDLPIVFCDIKARKPIAVSVTHHQVSRSDTEMTNIIQNTTVSITKQSISGTTSLPSFPANLSIRSIASTGPQIQPSRAYSGQIYTLGTLGYDFGSETRRDLFTQRMPAANSSGALVPGNPYDARQMIDYLDHNPAERRALIWTVSLNSDPIYALDPKGPFSDDIYEMLLLLLNGQNEPEDSEDFVERVSIPARQTRRTVELFSGQVVPVINIHNTRGMYGWQMNALIDTALAVVEVEGETEELLRQTLTAFLNRVYNELHNVGQLSRDRALNFATTNIFQAATTFSEAIADGRQLDTIEVEKSPFCRLNSDCWDIKLKFFDPDSSRRANKVFRFTIDVSDSVPVTLGKIKSWSIPNVKRKPNLAPSTPPG